jgi:hypothetical protein
MHWIDLVQDSDQWVKCEHDNEPSGSVKGGEFSDSLSVVSFSKRTLIRVLNKIFVERVCVSIDMAVLRVAAQRSVVY